ncbi:MAG TPA: hypothetical protein VFW39_00690 [Sphingomicrobium sp.]|nr:hypothetical protein [Sphingomicrobium sp.]
MIAEESRELPVRQHFGVNFAPDRLGPEKAIPQERKQASFGAVAQPVRTLAADAGGNGGLGYAAGRGERARKRSWRSAVQPSRRVLRGFDESVLLIRQ